MRARSAQAQNGTEDRHNAASTDTPAQPGIVPQAIPFVAGAHEHTEPAFTIGPLALTAVAQDIPLQDIPPYGYARNLLLVFRLTGGTLGPGVMSADYPWNVILSAAIEDVNGGQMEGPLSGWSWLWANIAAAPAYEQDPRRWPTYVSTFNAVFYFRVPLEIAHHNALGALPNQNSSSTYKFRMTLNTTTNVYSTQPTAPPNLTVRAHLEAWTQPADKSYDGHPQSPVPPGVGTGLYITRNRQAVSVGDNTIPIKRVGNLVRSWVFECRDASGVRQDTVFPDPYRFNWDGRAMFYETQDVHKIHLWERIENLFALDTGMFLLSLDHATQNRMGDGEPAMWWQTVQASRIEVAGVAAVAGTMDVITLDVQPVEIHPSERFVETSLTGFHPAMVPVQNV